MQVIKFSQYNTHFIISENILTNDQQRRRNFR
jgi:hypothetical protein